MVDRGVEFDHGSPVVDFRMKQLRIFGPNSLQNTKIIARVIQIAISVGHQIN